VTGTSGVSMESAGNASCRLCPGGRCPRGSGPHFFEEARGTGVSRVTLVIWGVGWADGCGVHFADGKFRASRLSGGQSGVAPIFAPVIGSLAMGYLLYKYFLMRVAAACRRRRRRCMRAAE